MSPQHQWQAIVVQGGAPIRDTGSGRWQTPGPADLPTMGYHPSLWNGVDDETCWLFRWQGRLWRTQGVFVRRVNEVEEVAE